MIGTGWLARRRGRTPLDSGRSGQRCHRRALDLEVMETRALMTAAAGAAHTAHAQAADHARVLTPQVVAALNTEIYRQIRANNLPGVAVEITVPGERPFVAAQGTSDIAAARNRGVNDPFRIASITKTFTATAVLQLIDRGVLHRTDTVARWLPTFPDAANITIDDLLRMRSGIPEVFDGSLAAAYYADPTLHITADQIIALAAARPGDFRPAGVETIYTNTNYSILERIVELTTGRSLGAQIQRTVVRPLGLAGTYYPIGVTIHGPLHGYSLDPATGALVDKTRLDPAVAGGAGAMVSTVGDLTRYARALATGKGLLSPQAQAVRLDAAPIAGAPSYVRYGEGGEEIGQFIGHNGTIYGFSSEMFYLPALRATIVVNVNRLDQDDASQSTPLFLALTQIAFPQYVNW